MRWPVPALLVSQVQCEVLESVSPSAPHREVVRARALSVSPASVSGWRARFAEEGLVKFGQVRAGRGRKKTIPQDKIDQIVDLTLNYRPAGPNPLELPDHGRGHRGVEIDCAASMVGARPETAPGRDVQAVQRSEVREKLVDVVGLYLNPPREGDRVVRR